MRRSSRIFLSVLSMVAFAGCFGSGSGGGAPGGGDTPRTKEEALSKLSQVHRQNFEAWMPKVVKACDASQAFGLSGVGGLQPNGVDGAALLRANGESVVFSEAGSLAILTSYTSFSGTGNSKVEETQEVNGQKYSVSVEAKRNGSQCQIYLFGQKVYETAIVESFTIGTQWIPGKQAQATSGLPRVRSLGASGISEVVEHGLYNLLGEALKPSKEATNLFVKKLNLSAEEASRLFKLNAYSYINAAVRIDNEPSAVWSSPENKNLIAQDGVLTRSFDGAPRTLPLEVRLAVPFFDFSSVKNTSDKGSLKLTINVLISKKETSLNYSTQSADLQGHIASDKLEGLECAQSRAQAYVGSSTAPYQIQPSVPVMFGPCRVLYSDIETVSYEEGLMKSLIPLVLSGVTPSDRLEYGGWDDVVSRLAWEALEQGKNIRAELDPHAHTKVVGLIADHLEPLQQELKGAKNGGLFKGAAYQMGLDWSLKGQVVSPSRISNIIQALDNSAEPFLNSSQRLLNSLGRDPYSGEDELSFARAMTSTYKTEALKALGLAKELNYVEFEQVVFNQVLQRKTSVEEFRDWSVKLGSLKSEISKYSQLAPVKGDLVGLAIKWLKSGEVSSGDLSPIFAAVDNSMVPFEESTKELVRALSQSLQANKEGLEFARSLSPEYKQLALRVRENSKTAEYESWGRSFFASVLQKRPSLEQLRAWDDLWNAALAFTQREKSKTQGELGSSNEWNRKSIIDMAVKEVWGQADFTGLEVIAEVARSKNTCERHKGSSSLADCAGLRLFSKQNGMFLDPKWGGRYVTLARDYAVYMSQLSDFSWTSLKWTMMDEFFDSYGPIWSKCDQSAFAQKASALKSQINAIVRAPDQFKKWELERQIKETVQNCR